MVLAICSTALNIAHKDNWKSARFLVPRLQHLESIDSIYYSEFVVNSVRILVKIATRD